MLGILESANLKPRTCDVMTIDIFDIGVDEYIRKSFFTILARFLICTTVR